MGLVVAEVSVPLLNAIGDGGLYTLWAGLQVGIELMTILVMLRGAGWREAKLRREREMEEREMDAMDEEGEVEVKRS